MRIGICGAQGTGKSTLARALAKDLNLPLIEEQARIAAHKLGITRPSKDLTENPDLGIVFELYCLTLQLRSEEQCNQGFVSDRTLIDIVVYWKKWCEHKSPPDLSTLIYDLCKQRAQKYDLVVYVPTEIPLKGDNFRSTDKRYQAEMDSLARTMIEFCSPPRVITVTGTVEERVAQVLAQVNR